jgi:lysophospholipase L1-like esterase
MARPAVIVLFMGLVLSGPLHAAPLVSAGDRVAIVGDSITEQKLYSRYVECYLLACAGIPDVHVMQFGWGGETAGGFANRAVNDLRPFGPTVVTLCYGMNDGGYQPWKPEIGAAYEKNMRAVLTRLGDLGVRRVVIGSPGAVDTHFFRPGQAMGDRPAHEAYNDTLAHLRDIDRALAADANHAFADVHGTMSDAMGKAQAALGTRYDVCGGDGFHPGPNGQLLMAEAFLTALGLDGAIGTVTIDWTSGAEPPTAGHAIVSKSHTADISTVVLASTRWPFCFEGDPRASGGTRSIVPFTPFNERLNRFVLVVRNLDAARAAVTWGSETREFSRDELAAGVNLAAAFPSTPFDQPFAALQAAVAQKQGFETTLIKQVVTNFRLVPGIEADAEARRAADVLIDRLLTRWRDLDAAARARVVPVSHTITVKSVP